MKVKCGSPLLCGNKASVSLKDWLLDFLLISPQIHICQQCKEWHRSASERLRDTGYLRRSPVGFTAANVTEALTGFGSSGARAAGIVETLKAVSSSKPKPCTSCRHYHGHTYNGTIFVCAMHPYGPESEGCPDTEEGRPDQEPSREAPF
jgi:hypothetical protein